MKSNSRAWIETGFTLLQRPGINTPSQNRISLNHGSSLSVEVLSLHLDLLITLTIPGVCDKRDEKKEMGERTGELCERRERGEEKGAVGWGWEEEKERRREECAEERGRGKRKKRKRDRWACSPGERRRERKRKEEGKRERERERERERNVWLREMRGEDNAIFSQPTTY